MHYMTGEVAVHHHDDAMIMLPTLELLIGTHEDLLHRARMIQPAQSREHYTTGAIRAQ